MYEILAVAKKELTLLARAKVTFTNAIVIPFVLLFVFAYALSGRIRDIPLAVLDYDNTALSRSVVSGFMASDVFVMRGYAASEEQLRRWMDEGKVKAGLVIPAGLAEVVKRGAGGEILVLVDGSEGTVAGAILGEVGRISEGLVPQITTDQQIVREGTGTLAFLNRILYSIDLNDINFFIPGIFGYVLFFFCLNVLALEIAKERETGTIEQINVSPMRPVQFLIGKSLPYLCLFLLEAPLMLLGAWLMFPIRIAGSVALILFLSTLLVIVSVMMALLISANAPNQREADNAANIFILPNLLLSGVIFPLERMPQVGRYISEVLPLTHYLKAVRAVMLKGAGLDVVWPQVLILIGYALLLVILCVMSYRKTSN